jgi:hypothetical protein
MPCARSPVDVHTHHAGAALAVDLETAAADGVDVVALEDRVGALDGLLSIIRDDNGHVRVHAELPCAS